MLVLLSLLATSAPPLYRVHNPVSAERKAELLRDVKAKVRGIALPLLTFYQEDGSVDHAGMTSYVHGMMADGVVEGKGVILAVASGGDFPSLSMEERKATAKTIIDAAHGGVPCFLSVQESHLAATLELARHAEALGYYGIQVSVPYYWTTSDSDAVAWFEAVHNATSKVIINLYNTPWENYDVRSSGTRTERQANHAAGAAVHPPSRPPWQMPLEVMQEVAKLERVRVLKFYTDRAPQTFRWAQARQG